MAYVDGFLVQVPTKNIAAYKKMSRDAGVVWMEHGALDYKECVGDDLEGEGMHTTFAKALKLKADHSLVFSWITYASKAERNRILKIVMADPRLNAPSKMPFDPKTMLYGGFDAIVDMAPSVAAKKKSAAVKKKSVAKKKAKR